MSQLLHCIVDHAVSRVTSQETSLLVVIDLQFLFPLTRTSDALLLDRTALTSSDNYYLISLNKYVVKFDTTAVGLGFILFLVFVTNL